MRSHPGRIPLLSGRKVRIAMRERFYRFMQGRYGNDRLNQALMILTLVFMLLSFFGHGGFSLLALLLLGYSYFRMFSRNIYARSAENQWYLKQEGKVRGFFSAKKREISQRKTHCIFKCPNCKQKIRVPRGHGRIEITCRKCGNKFIRKT